MRLLTAFLVVLGLSAPVVAAAAPQPAAQPAATTAAAAPTASDTLVELERAVARDSSQFDNLYRLGVMYMDREQMQQAMQVFGKAATLKPHDVKVLVNLGIAADALGHPEDAQYWYQKALDVAPTDSMASCRMASSKYAQGKYDEAMGMLRTILARSPRAYCAYFTLGVAFADAGIYRDAIRMWHKVVDLAPDSPEAVSAKESIDVLEKFLAGK